MYKIVLQLYMSGCTQELDKECTMPILENRIMDLKRQELAVSKQFLYVNIIK